MKAKTAGLRHREMALMVAMALGLGACGGGGSYVKPTPTTPTATPHHPALEQHRAARAADVQLRIADKITAFAGSMRFVYIHAVAFAVWMLVVESDPWPKLTLIVSLEAIFLSTCVMIGQNRQSAFQQDKADHDFVESELELKTNTELTRIIHKLTEEIHAHTVGATPPPT